MKDKLREILAHNIFAGEYYSLEGAAKRDIDLAITEILSLVKECVGEDYNKDTKLYPYRTEFEDYEEGWNDRGKQFLANIEGTRKEDER